MTQEEIVPVKLIPVQCLNSITKRNSSKVIEGVITKIRDKVK
jgi:hypothetical protein